jgi:hypothetical protein
VEIPIGDDDINNPPLSPVKPIHIFTVSNLNVLGGWYAMNQATVILQTSSNTSDLGTGFLTINTNTGQQKYMDSGFPPKTYFQGSYDTTFKFLVGYTTQHLHASLRVNITDVNVLNGKAPEFKADITKQVFLCAWPLTFIFI